MFYDHYNSRLINLKDVGIAEKRNYRGDIEIPNIRLATISGDTIATLDFYTKEDRDAAYLEIFEILKKGSQQ